MKKIKIKDQYLLDCKCIEKGCNHLISYNNWKYGERRCKSCASKRNPAIFEYINSHKGQLHPRHIDGRCSDVHTCVECGKNTSLASYYGEGRCKSCATKNDRNPNWQEGISKLPYSFDFTPELKELIRTRDNHECQNCGKKQKKELEEMCRKLAIHHIDYNKENCKSNNLITLCNKCNAQANFNRIDWTKFYQQKAKIS